MKRTVVVTSKIEVEIDESKFTEEFLNTFRDVFYQFYELDDHIKHLAQLYARGICDGASFIDGYGWAAEMGIKFKNCDQTEELE